MSSDASRPGPGLACLSAIGRWVGADVEPETSGALIVRPRSTTQSEPQPPIRMSPAGRPAKTSLPAPPSDFSFARMETIPLVDAIGVRDPQYGDRGLRRVTRNRAVPAQRVEDFGPTAGVEHVTASAGVTRVDVVDGNARVREDFRALLELGNDIVVVGVASDGRAAVALCGRLLPDVVVVTTFDLDEYAPATSPHLRRRLSVWPPDRRYHPIQEFPYTTTNASLRGCALQPSPHPPGWSWWSSLEGRSAAGSLSLRLSISLAGPKPSGSTGPSRLCQGCCPPSPPSQGIRLPSASTSPLRRTDGGVLSPPQGSRTPRGARNPKPTARLVGSRRSVARPDQVRLGSLCGRGE